MPVGLAECADPVWLLNSKSEVEFSTHAPLGGGGGFNRSAHSARPGILCFVFAELFDFSFCGATCSEEPSQISDKNHQVYQNCAKNDQGGSKKGPKSIKTGTFFTQGGAKIDKNVFRDPFETQGATKTQHCLLYTSPSPRDRSLSRMPSSA